MKCPIESTSKQPLLSSRFGFVLVSFFWLHLGLLLMLSVFKSRVGRALNDLSCLYFLLEVMAK